MGKIIRNGVEYSGACEDATAVNYNNSLSGLEAQTVQEGLDELSSNLGNLKFAQDAEGNWGYIPSGADAVIPFSSSGTSIYKSATDGSGTISAFTVKAKKLYIVSLCYTTYNYSKLNIDTNATKTVLMEKAATQAEVGALRSYVYLYESDIETDFTISMSGGKGCTNTCVLVSYA